MASSMNGCIMHMKCNTYIYIILDRYILGEIVYTHVCIEIVLYIYIDISRRPGVPPRGLSWDQLFGHVQSVFLRLCSVFIEGCYHSFGKILHSKLT